MGRKAQFLGAFTGISGLVICGAISPAGAAVRPHRQPPASTAPSRAVAGQPHQATGRTRQAALVSEQLKTWSQRATVSQATATRSPATAAGDGGITVYSDSEGHDPAGIVAGSDGALWYTNAGASVSIGRITTAGKITHYTDPRLTRPFGIARGSDGALWFTNGSDPGSIGRITTSGKLTFFDAPRISEPDWIAAGPDGALWFTNEAGGGFTAPSIERLTTTGTLTTFTAPSISAPAGIAAGPDGAMWFVNSAYSGTSAGSIGRITTSGTVTEYTYPGSFQPKDITAGPDHALWFVNGGGGSPADPSSIERITTGGVVTDFVQPGFGALGSGFLGGGGGMTEGADTALWFTDYGSRATASISVVGRMTAGGALSTYVTPGRDVAASEIASGPGNTLWFTMGAAGIGRVSSLAFTSGPQLSRPVQVGKAVTCQFSGLNVAAWTVAWLVDGTVVKGAAGRGFTPAPGDLNKELSCSVTLTNAGGSLTKTSPADRVALGAPLKAVKDPALTGAHKTGKPEKVTQGTWAPAASSYSYQWYLGGSVIVHATSGSYTPPAGDRGKKLRCAVTARRPGYANGTFATASVTLS